MVPPISQRGDSWIDGDRITPWELNTRFGISREEITAFQASIRIYPYGSALITEGDNDQTLFLVRYGTVAIQKQIEGDHWEKIGTVEATNFIGEMTLFNETPRDASVIADSDEVVVYAFTKPNLSLIFANSKWAEMLISRLCRDLSAANAQIVAVRKANRELEEAIIGLNTLVAKERDERSADQVKLTRVLATLNHYQKSLLNLSVYGSKSWTYLNAFPGLAAQLSEYYFPGLEIPPERADEMLMIRLLKRQQALLPKTLLEDLTKSKDE